MGGLLIFRKTRARKISKSSKKFLALLYTLGVLLVIAWSVMALERSIVPTLIAISETEVARVTNEALVDATNKHITAFLEGKTLLFFEMGQDGSLLYIKTNAADLNRIQADALHVLQNAVNDLKGFTVYVPLGQILGSKVFASLGPKVKVTLFPFGAVRTQVKDTFDVTGINQARYNIFLSVDCVVNVVIPFISSSVEVATEIPLTTILIPGKVPDTYLTLPSPPKG